MATLAGELYEMLGTSKPIKVFLESPQGEVIDLTGYVTHVEISQKLGDYFLCDAPGIADTCSPLALGFDLRIEGTHMEVSQRDDFVKHVHQSQEWRCAYCEHVNPKAAKYCGQLNKRVVGCGAPRSVVYDL